MKGTQHTFKRYEKKYLLTPEQYGRILPELGREMREDEYGQYTICNIYYDTQSFELVRASMAKPVYKEKFRLRSYGVPDREGVIYAEIKKKYDGVVCKRRVAACPDDIQAFITEGRRLDEDREIQQEIRCFFDRYHPQPKVFIGYDRMALAGKSRSCASLLTGTSAGEGMRWICVLVTGESRCSRMAGLSWRLRSCRQPRSGWLMY